MALSNIRREPRREIIESFIGIVGLFALVYLDFKWAVWFQTFTGGPPDGALEGTMRGMPWPLGMGLGVIIPFLLCGLVHLTHWLGEVFCGWLRSIKLDPRPRTRY